MRKYRVRWHIAAEELFERRTPRLFHVQKAHCVSIVAQVCQTNGGNCRPERLDRVGMCKWHCIYSCKYRLAPSEVLCWTRVPWRLGRGPVRCDWPARYKMSKCSPAALGFCRSNARGNDFSRCQICLLHNRSSLEDRTHGWGTRLEYAEAVHLVEFKLRSLKAFDEAGCWSIFVIYTPEQSFSKV